MWLSCLFHSPLSQPHLAESSTSTSQHPPSVHHGPHARYQAKHFTHFLLILRKPLRSSHWSTHFTYENTELLKRKARTSTDKA